MPEGCRTASLSNRRRWSGYTIPKRRQFDYAVRRHHVTSHDGSDNLLHSAALKGPKIAFDSEDKW